MVRLNSKDIEKRLASHFGVRQNLCVVNVSWGMFWWGEADFVRMTKSGYLTEVEIKTTLSDLRKDREKKRWSPGIRPYFDELISEYYVALPLSVYMKSNIFDYQPIAGILTIDDKTKRIEYKRGTTKKRGRKLKQEEQYQLARLGALRYWRGIN